MGKTFSTGLLTDGISQDSSNNIGIGVAPSGTNKFEVSGSTKLNGNTAITGSLSVSGSITGSKDALINGLTIGRGGDNMSSNTAIGSGVLQSNITGSYSYGANTGIGYQALFSHVDGTQNTAVGYQSLFSTLSTSNVGIGYQALYSSSYGDGNIGIGYRALYNNYSGGSNVALGYYSLGSNYTGDQNIALGLYTLYYNTTGDNNTAVGTRTLNENITGNNNTALGYTALNYNKTGSYNTAVGDKALINMGGSNNTAIGASAGYGNGDLRARTGTNNIFIGYQSMGVSENDSNRTWIGNTSTTSTWLGGTLLLGTTTSSINILEVSGSTRLQGNITVTGSLSVTGSATTIGATTLSGSLTVSGSATTIGATTLSGSLNVSGSITSTSTITAQTLVVQTITSSVLYSSGSNIFGNSLSNTQTFTGSVGITGSLTLNNIAIPTSASLASTYLQLAGGTLTGALGGTSATFSSTIQVTGTSNSKIILYPNYSGGNVGMSFFNTSNVENIYFNSANGSIGATTATFSSTVTAGGTITNQTSGGDAILYAKNGTVTTMLVANTTGELVGIGGTESNHPYVIRTNNGEKMRILSNGRVGIGTTNPADKLVISNSGAEGIEIGFDSGVPYLFAYNRSTSAYKPIAFVGSGNVIITTGTIVDAGYKLDINSSSTYKTLMLRANAIGTRFDTALEFNAINVLTSPYARIGLQVSSASSGGETGGLTFWTINSGTLSEKMCVTSDGNVLVGRTSSGLTNSSGTTISAGSVQAEVNGYVFYGNRTTSDGTFIGIRRNNVDVGSISVTTSATAFNTSSDYRLKTDFKEFNALSIIDSITTYDFAWKIDNTRAYGVKAHELQNILPYVVFGEKDEINEDDSIKPQAVDYSKLVPVLVKAIQELSTKNDALQSQINELKNN
jgi:hypothetical protein